MTEQKKRVTYCKKCKRIKGIGCACGMSFKEKHIAIDKSSLMDSHRRLQEEKRRRGNG